MTNPNHDGIINMKVLGFYCKLYPNIKSISSHQFRLPIPEVSGFHFIPMLFIRHPIDRIHSIYNHFNRWDESHIFYKKAKELNLKGFIKWYFDSDNLEVSNNAMMKNPQVVFLSNLLDLPTISSRDLETAIYNISGCEILGLVERFDESLILARKILRKYFKNIDLSYTSQNVNSNRPATLKERIEILKNEVGPELFDKILKNNYLDLQLYQAAEKDFENRIQISKDSD